MNKPTIKPTIRFATQAEIAAYKAAVAPMLALTGKTRVQAILRVRWEHGIYVKSTGIFRKVH